MCSRTQNKEKGTAPIAGEITGSSGANGRAEEISSTPTSTNTNKQVPQARLEVTCHPEATSFRDEGGRLNYLFLFCILRPTGSEGLPKQVALAASKDGKIQLECMLEYEGGGAVHCSNDITTLLELYGNAGSGDKVISSNAPIFDCVTFHGGIRFRIKKLSRNHDGRRFCLRVSLKGIDESVVASCLSEPISILSKRKNSTAVQRGPESEARLNVETKAHEECMQLGKKSRQMKASSDSRIDLRRVLKYSRAETGYPIYGETGDETESSYSANAEKLNAEHFYRTDSSNESIAKAKKAGKISASEQRRNTKKRSLSKWSPGNKLKKNSDAKIESNVAGNNFTLAAPNGSKAAKRSSSCTSAPRSVVNRITLVPPSKGEFNAGDVQKLLGMLTSLQDQLSKYSEKVTAVSQENKALRAKVEMLEKQIGTQSAASNAKMIESCPPTPNGNGLSLNKALFGSDLAPPAPPVMTPTGLLVAPLFAAAPLGGALAFSRSHSLAPAGETSDDEDINPNHKTLSQCMDDIFAADSETTQISP